jgi:hypothetical protein
MGMRNSFKIRFINKIFYGLIALGFFSSCEKIIDLKLNTSVSQIVIQGNVYDQSGPYTVKITKTVDFDESNIYTPVTGAEVEISDNTGNTEVLTETSPGIYLTSSLQGVPRRTYTLTIKTDGKNYTASSTMPPAVNIDSIYCEKSYFGDFLQLYAEFSDPADTVNYYYLIQYINGVAQDGMGVANDELDDGQTIKFLFMPIDEESQLKTGDTTTVWLETIDKGVYDYYRTVNPHAGQYTTPANPVSNISNGALGYFKACSIRKKTLICE